MQTGPPYIPPSVFPTAPKLDKAPPRLIMAAYESPGSRRGCVARDRIFRTMTSEIAILNRHAVDLASDSAVTVTQWMDGRAQQRYFKGANKIFNISKIAPVGLMMYGAANLHGAPWELIAKTFRRLLGTHTHVHLMGYATSIFEYLRYANDLFPFDYQEEVFIAECEKAALAFLVKVCFSDEYKNADQSVRNDIFNKSMQETRDSSRNAGPLGDATENDVTGSLTKYSSQIIEKIESNDVLQKVFDDFDSVDVEKLAEVAVWAVYTNIFATLDRTGLVFSGYGEKEYFPSLVSYSFFSIILGKLLYKCDNHEEIGPRKISQILPFAMTDMVQTFVNGFSYNALQEIDQKVQEGLDHFEEKLKADSGVTSTPNETQIKHDTKEKIIDRLIDHMVESHVEPIKRVVDALPLDEMADLAETLITVESLKERVTKPSESVGGPIDVAVISKSDGFVWIKRKHYFDASLNPRYFQREGLTHG